MKINLQFPLPAIALILCATVFSGCSDEESPQTAQEDVEIIPAMPSATVEVQPVSQQRVLSPQVSLTAGDKYYFVKSMEQKLGIEPGNPIGRVWERVEFLFSLTVREEVPEGYILDVTFHNVRYQSDRGDQHVQYDSRSQAPVPPEVLPYRGMIDHGFTVYLDRGNRIVDVVGFDRFLAECFVEYPAELQRELMMNLGAFATDTRGKINSAIVFLDESFALLPFDELSEDGSAFPVGTRWTRNYSRLHPVPVEQSIDATLQSTFGDGKWAQVVINGELRPASAGQRVTSGGEGNRVTGGTIAGSCSVSLTTGLPKSCRIQREVVMGLSTARDQSIPVRKTIVTTLEAWSPPAQTSPE